MHLKVWDSLKQFPMTVFQSMLGYNHPREDFKPPHVLTLTGLTSKVKTTNDSSYMKLVFTNLNDIRQSFTRPWNLYEGNIVASS